MKWNFFKKSKPNYKVFIFADLRTADTIQAFANGFYFYDEKTKPKWLVIKFANVELCGIVDSVDKLNKVIVVNIGYFDTTLVEAKKLETENKQNRLINELESLKSRVTDLETGTLTRTNENFLNQYAKPLIKEPKAQEFKNVDEYIKYERARLENLNDE